MKRNLFVILFVFIVMLIVSITGPYNILHELNEERALEEFLAEDEIFKNLQITEID
ncbi:hypothetical protein [Halobacillus sp. A5]|uniref:hypothetical protein n=1 Tax=Halobacillus sp. A5 TaxID=2880263 RepID=UPI0020A62210|nr:hypothetical protein [Halobacillus sp. A5]MCP3026408.1 hypothetical protein [Halobacillus sp. A5]